MVTLYERTATILLGVFLANVSIFLKIFDDMKLLRLVGYHKGVVVL